MQIETTQLKFALSVDTGEIIGFVSKNPKSGELKGVREQSEFGKKIVVLSEELKGKIEPNVLYIVNLKPMHNSKGYVCIHAELKKIPSSIYYNN